MSWIYDKTATPDPYVYYGFTYLITNLTNGRMYVGRKYLTAKRGKKRVPSNWEKYWGSCNELLADIALLGEDNFKREILAFQDTRGQVNYAEVAEQFKRDVLHARFADGTRMYYNANIMSRWFVMKEKHSEASKAKLRGNQSAKGAVRSPETRKKMSAAKTGVPKTTIHRAKLSEANLDKPSSRHKSGHVGVFLVGKTWRSTWRGKYVGGFKTCEEAVTAREAARAAEVAK